MESTYKQQHITVVDDIPENICLVGTILREQGFLVSIAENGHQALAVAQNSKPDLILLDIMMPEMDGYETCRNLKKRPLTKDIPVIFMSALTEPVDKVKGFDAGAVDYLTKPAHKEELLARINTHLTIRSLHQKLQAANSELEEKIQARTRELEENNRDMEKNREMLDSILSSMDDLVFALDKKGKFLNFIQGSNKSRLYASSESFIGKSYKEIMPKDVTQKFDDAIAKLHACGKPQHAEYSLPVQDKLRWFSANLTMRKNKDGSYSGVTAVIRDFTERKKAVEALGEANKIINRSPAVVFLRQNSKGWPVNLVSENVKSLFGYSANDFTSGKINYANIVHPEDLKRVTNELIQRTHNEGRDDFSHGPYRIFTKDGKIKWLDDRTHVRRNQNGEITDYQSIVLDITERKQTEDQLRQVQKMETVGTLAGGLAHDFNNLLGGVLAVLSIIRKKLDLNQPIEKTKLEKYVSIMHNASVRATNTVKQLLTLSRKQELIFTPIDLNNVIKQVTEICESTIDKSVRLVQHFNNKRVMVNADLTAIEQALLNLCVNSAHAMTIMQEKSEKWGGDLIIKVDSFKADSAFCNEHPQAELGDYWILSVEDSGIGIASDTLAKIFDPFFTTKKNEEGTGLGLAMVFNTVSQHNGFVDVVSEKGVGSTFSIYLPALKEDMEVQKSKTEDKLQYSGEGLILVVDDENVTRITVKDMLEELGYQAILATNGAEGLKLFKQNHQDISAVLLDLSMPEMSAKETFLKMIQVNPAAKVLLTSGHWKNERVEELLALGVKDFIQKPLTLGMFSEAIYSIVYDKSPTIPNPDK